jgi:hypothetical protein
VEVAALEQREQGRCLARLNEDGQEKIRPCGNRCPLPSLALKTGIRFLQVCLGDDAQDVVSLVMPLFHPLHDVAAARHFPGVDVWRMSKRFQLVPNPIGPLAILAGVADEYVRHAQHPHGQLQQGMIAAGGAGAPNPKTSKAGLRRRAEAAQR